MSQAIQLYNKPLALTVQPTNMSVTGTLPDYTAAAYRGTLQVNNSVGALRLFALADTSVPPGAVFSVDQATKQIVLTWASASSTPTTMIPNGDFEQGDVLWDKGPGWTVQALHAETGTYCAHNSGYSGIANIIAPLVRVDPGKRITLTGRVLAGGSSKGNLYANCTLFWYDANQNPLSHDNGNDISSGTYDWNTSTATGTAPVGAAYVAGGFSMDRHRQNMEVLVDTLTWDYLYTTNPQDISYPVHLKVVDSVGQVATYVGAVARAFSLVGTYAAAKLFSPYTSDLSIVGGNGVYVNPRVTSGTLPSWATLSVVGTKLRISGTPTGSATTVSLTVAVDSSDGQTARSVQTIVVSLSTVIALVHFDDPVGSITASVADARGGVWASSTASGYPKISGAHQKFGSGCFNPSDGNAAGYLYKAIGNPGTGDFCYEGWVYPTSAATRGLFHLSVTNGGGASNAGLALGYNGGTFQLYHSGAAVSSPAYTLALNTYTAWAVERVGSTITVYINGVSLLSVVDATNLSGATIMNLGIYFSNVFPTFGYIDEFRATHGAHQYGGNYTPSAVPFL